MNVRPIGQTANVPLLVHIDVFELLVPVGKLTENQKFWSMVHPRPLASSADTHLARNQLRCGLAFKDQWPQFRDLLDALPCRVRKLSVNGQEASDLSIDIGQPRPTEDIFVVGSNGSLQGQTFPMCQNFLSLGFLPIRNNTAVRISLSPVVRSRRQKTEFTPLNRAYQTPFEQVDHLLSADLQAEVADSAFMVVAPTSRAPALTSVAGVFYADRSGAEPLEQVLLIVPTFMRFDNQKFNLLTMNDRK